MSRSTHQGGAHASGRAYSANSSPKPRASTAIGGPQALTGRIEIRDYGPTWPDLYGREAERIRGFLGDRVVRVEYGGSTSVPGLVAKPVIDIVLEVPDSSEEPT